MIGWLRFVGLINAAAWFGTAVFFTVAAGPIASSEALRGLLGSKHPYFAQATALILMERYLNVSIACGAIALLHFGAEWLYFGRSPRRLWILLVLGLLSLSLVEATWVAPRLNRLHVTAHAPNVTESQHQAAAASFAAWRGVVKAADLVVLCALAFYLWRVANPGEPTRFSSAGKFRG